MNTFSRLTFTIIAILTATLSVSVFATDYYVSPSGSDTNPGTTLASPFATVQHCIDTAISGDTCHLRGGMYRETVMIPNGKDGITLTNYLNERPVISTTYQIT